MKCESEFLKAILSERSRLFCAATVDKLDGNVVANKISATRCELMVLFVDEILPKCCAWINERNALNAQQDNAKLNDIYRFLFILLFSKKVRFSLGKTIELLARIGINVPGKDIIYYISNNILAYIPIYRGNRGMTWTERRDETPLLSQFERAAFYSTRKVFFNPNYLLATLDDDL